MPTVKYRKATIEEALFCNDRFGDFRMNTVDIRLLGPSSWPKSQMPIVSI